MFSLGQKSKCLKTSEKHIYKHTRVVLCKKPLGKHQIFEQSDDFENRPSCKGCSPRKGYSLCKMLSLGQQLKCLKTCKKHIYKHTRVVLCIKTAGKDKIFQKWDDFENRPSCKGYSPCKGYSLCKIVTLGQKLKWPKTCTKRLYKKTRVVLWKNRWKKHLIFEKWDDVENPPSCKGYTHAKAIASAKCSVWVKN